MSAAGWPRVFVCDQCGAHMRERNCKVTCPNCGYRFDCSDLTLNFETVTDETNDTRQTHRGHSETGK